MTTYNLKEGDFIGKPLAEMSMEELWQLFPIQLTQHQSYWKEWYEAEKDCILPLLSDTAKIHHIGRTETGAHRKRKGTKVILRWKKRVLEKALWL